MEYETDVEEERIRVKSLLENLRIQAEIKVFWLAAGSLSTYEIIVNGNSPGPEAEAEVEECLKDQEWWEEMQKIRGKRGQPLASGIGLDVENLLGSSAWPDASFQQGPRHEKVERFLGLRNLLHKSKRRRTMSGFSKLGVNLGMRAQKLPAQLAHRASSERDYSDSESSSDDSDEDDNDDDQSIASEADADDRELDGDSDLRSPTKLVRRKSHGDAMRGPPPARSLVAPKESTSKNKTKSTTASNTTTPARSLKDFDTSSSTPSLKELQEDGSTAPATSSKMEPPPPRKLEERFSALRQSPSKSQLSPTKLSQASSARERPILSRHASSQKFSSKPVPVSQVASEDGAGPSIMFIDTPSPPTRRNRLQSAYRSQDDNGGTSSKNPSSSPPKSIGSTYSTQSLPLSFNDLPCRAQHLILNELMRQNSEDTAVMFTTLPSPSPGTHTDEEACIAYVSDLEVLGRGCPPCLMVHSNSMTVTMSL